MSTWSHPGNVFGANSSTLRAVDPTDLGFEVVLGAPEVEVTPAPSGAVVVRGGRSAARTLVGTLSTADAHHHLLGCEGHSFNDHAVDGDDAIRCSGSAHAVPRGSWCLNASETTRTTCAPFNEGQALRTVAVDSSGDWPFGGYTPRPEFQVTHGNPRSPKLTYGFSCWCNIKMPLNWTFSLCSHRRDGPYRQNVHVINMAGIHQVC